MNQSTQSQASRRKPGRPKNPDLAQRLIRATRACFARRGFDGIAMDEIAWKAGMSKMTIYHCFRNKQTLLEATLDDLLAQIPHASELTYGITGDSIEAKLLVVAQRLVRVLASADFELIRRSLASDLPPPLRERILETAALPYFRAIQTFLDDQADRGVLDLGDTRSATSLFIALVAGPEELHSRWSGSTFGPIDDADLLAAVQVFVKGHACQPKHGTCE